VKRLVLFNSSLIIPHSSFIFGSSSRLDEV
jgi:hypothetical protein